METTMIDSNQHGSSRGRRILDRREHPSRDAPRVAPIAKASSFRRVVSMPIEPRAPSSSRIASQARPIAGVLQPQADEDHREQDEEQEIVVLDRPAERHAEENVRLREIDPSSRIGSMRAIPCGPLVMLTGPRQVVEEDPTISPKPSVTIAR